MGNYGACKRDALVSFLLICSFLGTKRRDFWEAWAIFSTTVRGESPVMSFFIIPLTVDLMYFFLYHV